MKSALIATTNPQNHAMKDYSAKQIKIWEQSTVDIYTRENPENPGQLTIDATDTLTSVRLLSLFCEGFILAGKTDDGKQLIKNVDGVTVGIHSKSLARALRKKAKRHAWSRIQYITDNRHKMAQMIGIQNGIQWLAIHDADVGIEVDENSPAETYILFVTKEIRHIFRRLSWCSPLEYLGRA